MKYRYSEGCACCVAVMLVLFGLLVLCFCTSCTKRVYETEYVEKPVYLHDTLRTTIFSHDSTIVKDSVYFAIKGDTIYKERYNTKWQIKVAHDTVMRFVEKPVEVVSIKEVEKQVEVNRIYWWQKLLMWIGVVGILVGLFTAYKLIKTNGN